MMHSARRGVGYVESNQGFQPHGYFARHRREAFDPSHDGCLVPLSTASKFALGPSEDGEADQQPVAGHGGRRRGRFQLRPGVLSLPPPRVFKMNTIATSARGFQWGLIPLSRSTARRLGEKLSEVFPRGDVHRQIVTGSGANGAPASGIVTAKPRRHRLAASSPRLRR